MTPQKKATQQPKPYSNPQETLKNTGKGAAIAQDIEKQRHKMEDRLTSDQKPEKKSGVANPEFKTIFSGVHHKEGVEKKEKIQELQSLITEIRHEIQAIKAKSEGLNAEVEQIEKATIESLPEKVGVYHVRHFEIILEYLRNIKAKVGEAKTWLMAMQSKKAKRGSAFATRSKKKGTQYSLSQELSAARNVS